MSFFVTPYTDEWGETTYQLTTAGYTAFILLLLAIFLIGCALFGKKMNLTTRKIAFSGIAIALGFVTSFIKLVPLPMGGSITLLSMFFIALIGYWYGLGTGLCAACAYGILQLVIDPYILSFPQMMLDYVFAFGALGLSGIFYKSKSKHALTWAYLTAIFGRFVFSFLSGWVFFGAYATVDSFSSPTINAIVYSILYNGSYIGAEALLTIIIISLPPVNKALKQIKNLSGSQTPA